MAARAKAKGAKGAKSRGKTKAGGRAKPRPKVAGRAKPAARAKAKARGGGGMGVGPPDPAVQAALDRAFGTHPELHPGQMFGCPGYFLGKKAVACVFGGEGCLTLPALEVASLVAQPGYRLFQARGRTMTGWILLDRPRVEALASDPRLVEHAIEYARSKAQAAG
jgi:hypothetical protein